MEETIAQVLVQRADAIAGEVAYIFLDDKGVETTRITYAELRARADAFAAVLSRYPRQSRVLLVLPTCVDFPIAFFGCVRAAQIAVALPVPNPHRMAAVRAIVDDCAPSAVVTTSALRAHLAQALAASGCGTLDVLTVDDRAAEPQVVRAATIDDVALLQYTSGSTSRPKGVTITHANVMANQRMIYQGFGHVDGLTVVGWAPLYHDQGLIGNLLQPLYIGGKCILMAPLTMMHKPLLWLKAISQYRAHTSGGPNFAYDLCVERYKPSECESLDLSCWKRAFNGAEPISGRTLQRFTRTFRPHGFTPASFLPCYGLAEATLYVSGVALAHVPAQLQALERAAETDSDFTVTCGRIHPDVTVLLRPVDGVTESGAGEICMHGKNVTPCYWNDRDRDAFFTDESGRRYLRTGDVGYVASGQLFVTGRIKELLIVRGRNVYPYDIERTISDSHQAFLKHGCAVFVAPSTAGAGDVVAVQEVERTARTKLDYEALAGIVRRNVARQHDVMLKRLYFTPPGFLPKTSSGKIQRALLAAQWAQGAPQGKILASV